jgi:hypothetical protein
MLERSELYSFQSVNTLTFIPFDQYVDLVEKLDPNKHQRLLEFVNRFDGLCELICNRILIDDLLGNGEDQNSIKNRVTLERMDEENIKKSHLLDVYSIFIKIISYLFRIYPDNIFSFRKQWSLVNIISSGNNNIRVVNRGILSEGLKNIAEGETLKFEVLHRDCLSLSGHSLLIKKMQNDKYIFFDPNTGEHRNLSLVQLSDNIDQQLALHEGTDIFLTRGADFLKRLKN